MIYQIIFNILISTSLYVLISFSFLLIYSTTNVFHLSHAILITLGAYFFYLFFIQFSFSIWVSILFSILLSIITCLIIEINIYKPLRKKYTSSLLFLIVSLGVYIILQNAISIIYGDDTKNIRIGELKVGNNIFGAFITNTQIITIFVSFTLVIASLIFLKYHKIGRKIRAVSSNSELAEILGINSNKVILWSFGIGSAIASIGGILVATDTGLTPTMGFNLLLYSIVAMIISGVGSTWGLIGGAVLLATSQHLTAFYFDSKWMDATAYTILILFLVWKPLGFSGKRLKKIEI